MATVDAAAVLATFRVIASEFASTSDDDVNALTSIEAPKVSADAFGVDTIEAVALRVAHRLDLTARRAAASAGARGVGTVTSVKTGDLALTYGFTATTTDSNSDAYWRQTGHGLAYLNLRDSQPEVGFGAFPFM